MTTLKEICSLITKQHGDGSVIMMDDSSSLNTNIIPTGLISLDIALGGGIPKGRQIEVFGAESSGKSSLALQFAAQLTKSNNECLYIDLENSLHIDYLRDLGIDDSKLAISQPDSGSEALGIAELAVNSGLSLVVIDSVSAILTSQENEGDYGDSNMASLARFMSSACRKINPAVAKTDSILLWINQTRDKISSFGGGGSITTGGKSLRFYASQRIELIHIGQLKDGEEVVGSRVKIKIVKNKISSPYRSCEMDLIYGHGFCRYGDALDLALSRDVVKRSGSWYSFGDRKLGQGRESVRTLLRENEELFNEIVTKLGEKDGS